MSGLGLTFLRRGNLAHPTAGLPYIRFADAEVERICIENFSKDGIGVIPEDVENLTDIGNIFAENKLITSFDEFVYFKSVKVLNNHRFYGCENLKSINLDNIVETKRAASNGALGACKSLTELSFPNVVTIGGWVCEQCTSLTKVDIGPYCTSIAWGSFRNCPITTFIVRALTPPTLSDSTLTTSTNIYVPDEVVDAYKTAWSSRAAKIFPLSSYTE